MTTTNCAVLSDTTTFTWRVEQGEREVIRIPVLNEDNEPRPVDGWTVDAKIKTESGGELLYTWPVGQITVTGNVVELVIPAAVSLDWPWRTGWWRVVITDPESDAEDPDAQRIIQGPFIVDPD